MPDSLQFFVQSRTAQTEFSGGSRPVIIVCVESVFEQMDFNFFEIFFHFFTLFQIWKML